jgi:AcrR family transcriptional regulator
MVQMEPEVKPSPPPKRRYDTSRRRAAAEQTRLAIVASARELFLGNGYGATTMPAIAEAAGVALDTVYAAIGSKPELLRHLIELAISGESRPVAGEERAYAREMREEPDARKKLARYARAIVEIHPRLAPLFQVLREAARTEPELAALWREIADRRAVNMRRLVADLVATGEVRPGLESDEIADFIWATNSPEFYLLLVEERGWLPERFQAWLAELWTRTLLTDSPGGPAGDRHLRRSRWENRS